MTKHIIAFLFILMSISSYSQVRIFSGHLGKYPIQLVTYSYSDGDTRATYAYDKYDTPIVVNGRQHKDSLVLFENNEKGQPIARFEFHNHSSLSNQLTGKWLNLLTQKTLEVQLNKLHEFDYYDKTEFEQLELMQPASTKEHYFRLLVSKTKGESMFITGVRIYKKKTDKLLQELDLECQFWGLNSISVGDFNFDGVDDFSVFESSYAGPNTSSVYILRNPKTDNYFISEITGISLEFDSEAKLIYEHNQCCAGRSHMSAIYKLVDNKMELIEQTCLEYDDEKEEFIEKDCD